MDGCDTLKLQNFSSSANALAQKLQQVFFSRLNYLKMAEILTMAFFLDQIFELLAFKILKHRMLEKLSKELI